MRLEGYYESCGEGRIHYYQWIPEGEPRAVLQIIHGIAETALRYEETALALNTLGYVVAAEEHMGHGKSTASQRGYFEGGWLSAVKDTLKLSELMQQTYRELPFAYFGHSMGSFMLRTILCKFPERPVDAAVISGTGWHPRAVLPALEAASNAFCRQEGAKAQSSFLNQMVFGNYNAKVEHRQTEFDWLTRDRAAVNAYLQDPDCGFSATNGLLRDMTAGLRMIENPDNLRKMKKDLPVFLIAGTMDPVGNYGKGVRRTKQEFKAAGMQDVSLKLYPLCRHELLNEINRRDILRDISDWLEEKLFKEEIK